MPHQNRTNRPELTDRQKSLLARIEECKRDKGPVKNATLKWLVHKLSLEDDRAHELVDEMKLNEPSGHDLDE